VQSSILGFAHRIFSAFSANIFCRSGTLSNFKGPSIMRRKQWASWILLGLAILSLPLCCLLPVALSPTILFWGQFTVINNSNETVYITPIGESYGQRHILVKNFSKFPYVPLMKQADIRLEPGERVRINFEADEDLTLSEITVRNVVGDYRQLVIDQPTSKLVLSETTYTIGSIDELSTISSEVLAIADQASQFNTRVWKLIIPGLIPGVLFISWYGLSRKKNFKSP
jgi:hypothetical protein